MRDEAPPVRPGSADSQLTTAVAPDLPLIRPGVAIGGYRIVRELGRGGMGVVWGAVQQQPRRPVALKVIRSGRLVDEHQVELVLREAQMLIRLEHPGIAAIYEAGSTADGEQYFAMELVRGETLAEYMATRRTDSERPLEVGEILSLFLQITDAVGYAHQMGVIHRDLKPSNILVTGERSSRDGIGTEARRIKIIDFSLARNTDSAVAADTTLSEPGSIWGTLEYMSPEQTRGNPDEIDLRSDVYSLGVILYELLTGTLPYQLPVTAVVEAIQIIREERPRSPARTWMENRGALNTTDTRLDPDLATIVLKALEKETSRRYQSASDLAGDVELYLAGQPTMTRRTSSEWTTQGATICSIRPAAGEY